jgi:hypothetical protein
MAMAKTRHPDWRANAMSDEIKKKVTPLLSGNAIEEIFFRWSEWTTEIGEAISRKNIDGFVSEIRADLEARAGEAVPQGWKLVPLEPSNKMTAVGQEHRYESVWSIGAIYREMIAHAPIPPTGDAAGKDSVDAARYRWLRSHNIQANVKAHYADGDSSYVYAEALDEFIDAAIASLTKTAD